MGLSRQEYWRGLPFPPPEDLPDPGIHQTCVSCVSCTGSKVLYHECHLGSPRSAHILFYFILLNSLQGGVRNLKKKKKTGEDGRGNPFLSTGDRNTNKMVYSWGLPGGPVVKTSLPMQGVPVQSLVGELRPHLPCGQKTKP